MFITTGYAKTFGNGFSRIVVGMSGTELVMEVLKEYDYSPKYWYGWILAYYQWKTSRSF